MSKSSSHLVTAELIHKTAVAYAWVEMEPSYNRNTIIEAVDQFSTQTYPVIVAFFGSEWNPGVDNDSRLHMLHATDVGAGGYHLLWVTCLCARLGFTSFGTITEYKRLVGIHAKN